MILREVKEGIYNLIEEHVVQYNFKFNKSKGYFEKSSNGCRFIYKPLFHSRSSEIAIELFVLIEYIEAEKIYKKASGHMVFETIGNEVGKLIHNPDGKMIDHRSVDLIIRSESDIYQTAKLAKKYFEEVALPYYETKGCLKEIDRVLNENPDQISVHANVQFFRCPKGLIIAKLAGRKNYHELEKKYDEKMASMSALYKYRYEGIKDYLSKL